jgi:hypothetical protein
MCYQHRCMNRIIRDTNENLSPSSESIIHHYTTISNIHGMAPLSYHRIEQHKTINKVTAENSHNIVIMTVTVQRQ